jgi:hypothetical protein
MNEVNCTSIKAVQCAPLIAPYDSPEVMTGTVLVPPPIRRGEGARSGAPSGMMAQTQPAQGRAVCGGPSDLAPDPRETAQQSDWWGRRPLVRFRKRAGLSKVTRPTKPLRGQRPRVLHGDAVPFPITRSGRLRLTANRPYDCTAQPCPLATGTASGWTPGCHRQRGPGRPYRPKNASQSLNTGCNPACRTASATSPRARSSWMANCSSSSLSPSA